MQEIGTTTKTKHCCCKAQWSKGVRSLAICFKYIMSPNLKFRYTIFTSYRSNSHFDLPILICYIDFKCRARFNSKPMVFGQSQIYQNILAYMRRMGHGGNKKGGSTLSTDLHISFFSLNILVDWHFNLSTHNNINLFEPFEISPSNESWLISIFNRPPLQC